MPAERAGSPLPPVVLPLLVRRAHRGLVKHPHGFLRPVDAARNHRLRGLILPFTRHLPPVAYLARLPVAGLPYNLLKVKKLPNPSPPFYKHADAKPKVCRTTTITGRLSVAIACKRRRS